MTKEERYDELYQLLLDKSSNANVEPVFKLETVEEISPDPKAVEVINQILEKAYLPFLCKVITDAGYTRGGNEK